MKCENSEHNQNYINVKCENYRSNLNYHYLLLKTILKFYLYHFNNKIRETNRLLFKYYL